MIREVRPTPIGAIGLVPPDFRQRAEAALSLLPEEWDAVYVSPELEVDAVARAAGRWRPTAYLGSGWQFVKAEHYVGLIVEQPERLRDHYLDRVRHAFEKAGVA